QQGAGHLLDGAVAIAHGARRDPRARARALTLARAAEVRRDDLDIRGAAECGGAQVDVEGDERVLPAPHARGRLGTPVSAPAAEERLEQVGEAAEARPAGRLAVLAAAQVVVPPLLRVGEDVVRARDGLELL